MNKIILPTHKAPAGKPASVLRQADLSVETLYKADLPMHFYSRQADPSAETLVQADNQNTQ